MKSKSYFIRVEYASRRSAYIESYSCTPTEERYSVTYNRRHAKMFSEDLAKRILARHKKCEEAFPLEDIFHMVGLTDC